MVTKLEVEALETCFAVPQPTNAKKAKSRKFYQFNGIGYVY
jgi:hypothetical protein